MAARARFLTWRRPLARLPIPLPTADAFDVEMTSTRGYGFRGKPRRTWGPDRIAGAWAVLIERLGYKRYVSQGSDWRSVVADAMARQTPPGLGNHVNMPATVPAD